MATQLPIHESFAIFLGITGSEWLIGGNTDLARALLIALGAACLILLARRLRRKRERLR